MESMHNLTTLMQLSSFPYIAPPPQDFVQMHAGFHIIIILGGMILILLFLFIATFAHNKQICSFVS